MNFTVDLFLNAMLLIVSRKDTSSIDLVRRLLYIYTKEKAKIVAIDGTSISVYVDILTELISDETNVNDKRVIDTLLLKYKNYSSIQNDPEIYTRLKAMLVAEEPLAEEDIDNLQEKLSNSLLMHDTLSSVKRMFGRLTEATSNSTNLASQQRIIKDIRDICSNIIEQHDAQTTNDDGDMRTTFLDFNDKESIKKACQVYEEVSVKSTIKTGLQGLNRALGGGLHNGESVVFNSLSHNGKSLMLLKMARWQVTLNRPNPGFKNPTCIIYSLENEVAQNLKLLYDELYINKFNAVPPETASQDEIVDFCFDEFARYGWKLIVTRKIGSEFGFSQLVADFDEYARRGFTPLMCVIDYMDMMNKGAVSEDGSGNHLQIKQLYTNMCNFLKARNCTLVTAHQLNRKAAEAVRNNPVGAVRRFGIDMLSGSMDPQREVDVVLYQNIEQNTAGQSFLTFKLDKHRYEHLVPDKYKAYFAYEFEGPLGIRDDLDTEDKTSYNIYAQKKEQSDDYRHNDNLNNNSNNNFSIV